MAKGVEDTAYYRWTRFVALQRGRRRPGPVRAAAGGVPRRAGRPAAPAPGRDDRAVHPRHQARRGRPGPAGGAGRDPGRVGGRGRTGGRSRRRLPDGALGHLLWQTVVGAWPIVRRPAARLPGEGLPGGSDAHQLGRPGRGLRGGDARGRGRRALDDDARCATTSPAFADRIARPGWSNALAAKLVQLTMPGVPDVYQGSELWDLSLVDPDNRRPVDFALRDRLLARLDEGWRPDWDDAGRRGQAAGRVPGAAAAPGPAGPVHRVRAGGRERARPPTTWSRSTAAAR